MARVTVEDCIEHIPNRFELVALSATRAKQIASGNPINLERDNDKDTVVSLREIAESKLNLDTLRNELTQSFQKYGKQDTIDDNIQGGFGLQKPRPDVADELTAMQMVDEDDLEDMGTEGEEGSDLAFGDDDVEGE